MTIKSDSRTSPPSFPAVVNWPYRDKSPEWFDELDGAFRHAPDIAAPFANENALEIVQDFRATRSELATLAAHYRDALLSIHADHDLWQLTNSTDWHFMSLAGSRLATIEFLLGPVEYEKAISQVEEKWRRRFAESDAEKSACGQSHASADDRPHGLCMEEARENLSPVAAAFPGITEEQAQLIYVRQPFIGMTLEQAEQAFGCLTIRNEQGHHPDGVEETWVVAKRAWSTEDRLLLTFRNGELVKFEDDTPDGE